MNRKTSMLLLITLVVMAGGLFATDSRMTALGYPYGFIRDNSDVTLYPATIFQYNRSVRAELGTIYYSSPWLAKTTSNNWTLNAHMPLKKNILGVYLNFPTGVVVDDHLNYGAYTKNTDLDISRKIQFYLGLMDKIAVGFGMAIDSGKSTDTYYDEEEKMSAHYFDLSAGMSDDIMDLGAQLYLAGASAENDDEYATNIGKASFTQFGARLAGRYFLMEEGTLDMAAVTNLAFQTCSEKTVRGIEDKATDYLTSHSDFLFDLGLGANYKPGPNHNIIFTVKPIRIVTEGWKYTNSANDDVETENFSWIFVPEYTLGLESNITKWLTGRVGAIQQYAFLTEKDEDDPESGDTETETLAEYRSAFDMNLGLAFKFGKFTVDTVLSKSLLHEGPDFIGGQTNGLATQVSVNFEF